jgi:hypothetical protein
MLRRPSIIANDDIINIGAVVINSTFKEAIRAWGAFYLGATYRPSSNRYHESQYASLHQQTALALPCAGSFSRSLVRRKGALAAYQRAQQHSVHRTSDSTKCLKQRESGICLWFCCIYLIFYSYLIVATMGAVYPSVAGGLFRGKG